MIPPDPDECWQWIGQIDDGGYARVQWGKNRALKVHRFVYLIFKGPIPDGYHVDHLCGNRSCTNPRHLEAVTPATNILRGRGACAAHARKQKCPTCNGEYTRVRNGTKKNGEPHFSRRCRSCQAKYQASRRLTIPPQ